MAFYSFLQVDWMNKFILHMWPFLDKVLVTNVFIVLFLASSIFVWCIIFFRNMISLTVFPPFITGSMQNNKKCSKANIWSICWKIWYRINWIWKLNTWHSSTYTPRCVISLKPLHILMQSVQWDNNIIYPNQVYHH